MYGSWKTKFQVSLTMILKTALQESNSLDFTTPFSSTHPQQSDLKSLYLTREELHKKKTPTHLTQSEIFDISLQE